jgi:hypothetical protein
MNNIWRYLSHYDKILLLLLIVISSFFLVLNFLNEGNNLNENKIIVIQDSDGRQEKIPVMVTYTEEARIIEVKGPIGISKIEVYNGRVRMKEAPPADPLKICEKTGWIEQPGPMIVCVPNKVAIWIEIEEEIIDGVSW